MRGEPKPSPDLELARAKAAELSSSFKEVFGLEKARSAAQRRVWDYLSVHTGEGANDYRFVEGRDGIAVALAAAQMDGARSVLRAIDKQLRLSVKSAAPKKKRDSLR